MDTRLLHQFIFDRDNKWDIQLQQGQIAERDLADLLCQKIELKSESYGAEPVTSASNFHKTEGHPASRSLKQSFGFTSFSMTTAQRPSLI